MIVTVAVTTVGAAFGLEGSQHVYKIRPKAMQHGLNHMVRPNSKHLVLNFGRQMPISKMPREAHKLAGLRMLDFNKKLRSCLYL